MRLLREDEVVAEPGERVVRHGVLGPLFLLAVLASPLAAAVAGSARLGEALGALPWLAWLVLGPVALAGGLLWLLCLHAAAQVARRAFLPTSWLLRASPAGLLVKLRSYQNAHFPGDAATVARFDWAELAGARRVRELAAHDLSRRNRVERSWLELELRAGTTDELARALAAERERRGPRRSFLGMTGSARYGHVPVHVAGPRLVRVEWLGAGMLRALEAHLEPGETRRVELATAGAAASGDLDSRLRELCRRGQRFAAIELARRELGESLADARRRVEHVGRESA